jgi:hypothetical protein
VGISHLGEDEQEEEEMKKKIGKEEKQEKDLQDFYIMIYYTPKIN